jgi:hypothetical protein
MSGAPGSALNLGTNALRIRIGEIEAWTDEPKLAR